MDIRGFTNTLIKKYKTSNPIEILSAMDVIIIYAKLYNVRGFYQFDRRIRIVYINEDLSEKEKMFVCAHELGHILLHKESNFVFMDSCTHLNTSKYEKEANLFAYHLLMSDEPILENCSLTQKQLDRILGYEEGFIEMSIDTYRSI